MRHRPVSRSLLAVVSLVSLAAACRSGGPTGSIAASTPTIGVTAPGSAGPSLEASEPGASPPAASLVAEGGDPVVGQLGSFTWLDGGSDSPWLPGATIEVGAGEPLTVSVGEGVGVADWIARRVPAGTTDGTGAMLLGEGDPPIGFVAPGPGIWSAQVEVRFADDLGSATYYWRLTVR